MSAPALPLAACSCCGLVQQLPVAGARQRVRCLRCHTAFRSPGARQASRRRTAALALAALLLYPVAMTLPIMQVERLGAVHRASILSGGLELFADGQVLVGLIVLLCSVVLPLVKLAGLFVLAGGAVGRRPRLAARTFHLVEWTGRWGMLDVLLVALLVAFLKLGQIVELHAGPAALVFSSCVLLNLLASASFDPHSLWQAPA